MTLPRIVVDPRGFELGSENLLWCLARWETLRGAEAASFYAQRVFPWACERMRAASLSRGPFAIAFVPVGTQPFSPILASLANPAQQTFYLTTEATKSVADTVIEVLSGEPSRRVVRSIGDGTDDRRIARLLLAEHAAAGYPQSDHVVTDLTGGRKATIAALGATAAICAFQQGYIEGQPSAVHRGFFVEERFVVLRGVETELMVPDRREALALLRAGAFDAARQVLRRLAEQSGAAAADRCLAEAARAWARWTQGRWGAAAKGFAAARRPAPKKAAAFMSGMAGLARCLALGENRPLLRWARIGLVLSARNRGDIFAEEHLLSRLRVPTDRRSTADLRRALRTVASRCPELEDTVLRQAAEPAKACDQLVRFLGEAWSMLK